MIPTEKEFWSKLSTLIGGPDNMIYVEHDYSQASQIKAQGNNPKSFLLNSPPETTSLLFDRMVELGLIEAHFVDLSGYCYTFTIKGINYQEYEDQKAKSLKAERRKERVRHWVSVVISNLLAVVAIIISIIALVQSQK